MIGTKEKQADQTKSAERSLLYDKIPDPKIRFYEIPSHYVQLYFCKYGIWNHDGKCGI